MSSAPRAPRWPLLLALSVLMACVTIAARAAMAGTAGRFIYALDDAYIHMAMARNLAQHGVWGCTQFQFSSASSSPLWTALLGLVFLLTGVHDVTPLLLNVLLLALTLGVSDAFLRRCGATPLVRAATLVGLVVVFPMPAMALFGMEHVLHLLLTIAFGGAAVVALTSTTADLAASRRPARVMCLLAGLLAASRYEGLFLAGLVCVACVANGRWRLGIATGLAAAVPVTVVGLASVASGSLFLPNSLMLKAGGETASTWAALLKPVGVADLTFLELHSGLLWLVVGGIGAALVEVIRTRQIQRASVLLPLGLALMVLLHVHFELSSPFWVYRYDAYLLGFGVFTAGVVLAEPWAIVPASPAWARGVLPALTVLGFVYAVGDVRGGLFAAQEIASASLTYREHYQAARFVREWHPGETVLVNDLGAMAYFSNARPLDIFGLCDIEPVILRRSGHYSKEGVLAWTTPYRPSIAVVQLSWGWAAEHVPDTWRKVAEVDVMPEGRSLGFFTVSGDAAAALKLRAEVERHYGPMSGDLGYRLHLF